MFKSLGRNPGFALAATVSIGLAVGANSAIFGLVDALWFRPLPVANPERVVVPYRVVGSAKDREVSEQFLLGDRRARLSAVGAFASVALELGSGETAAFWTPRVRFSASDTPLTTAVVDDNYFQTLGVRVHGRPFLTAENIPGAPAVAIISDRLWRARFGARIETIGSRVETTKGPLVIVGIADRSFTGARIGERVDVWIPFGTLPQFSEMAALRETERLTPVIAYARLDDGVSVEEAEAQIRGVLGPTTSLRTLRAAAVRAASEGAVVRQDFLLRLLWIAAGLMLLLGSANLAALLLARAEARRHELALRMAVGAKHRDLVGLVLREAGVLCICGLALGLVMRHWLVASMSGLELPTGLSIQALEPRLDWRIAMFGAGVAAIATAVAAAGAVRMAFRTDLMALLAASAPGTRRAMRTRQGLLATHVALSMTLLVGASAMGLTVAKAFGADLGFARNQLLFVELRPLPTQYPNEEDLPRRSADYAAFLDRIRALPDVDAARYGSLLLTSQDVPEIRIRTGGRSMAIALSSMGGGHGYLTTVGVRFVEGRDLLPSDEARMVTRNDIGHARVRAITTGQPYVPPRRIPVAIIDETFRRQVWPGEPAIGKRFTIEANQVTYEVVGVVSSVQANTTSRDVGTMFDFRTFVSDYILSDLTVAVRSRKAEALRPAVLALARQAFPDAAQLRVRTADQITAEERAQERLGGSVFSWFGLTSAVLGFVGIYGLVAYIVARSRRELGIRAALGASAARLRWVTASRALKPVGSGLVVGLALSVWTTKGLAAAIPGVAEAGPIAFVAAGGFFTLASLLAAAIGTAGVRQISPSDLLRLD